MPRLYDKQLLAISEMLKTTSKGLKMEAYDLLFRLWKENADSDEFIQDLMPLALEHEELVSELRARLNELSLRDTITNTFLREHLENLAFQVSKQQLPKKEREQTQKPSPSEPKMVNKQNIPYTKLQQGLIFLIFIIVLAVTAINFLYVIPRKDGTFATGIPDLRLSYKSPAYLSTNDENTVELSIENNTKTELEGTITLIFDDPEDTIKPAEDKNLSAEIDIHSHDQAKKHFSFLLTTKPTYKSLNYYFQFTPSKNNSQFTTDHKTLLIAPLPYLRSASNWLFGALGALIAALLGDQIKKIGGGALEKILDQLRGVFPSS